MRLAILAILASGAVLMAASPQQKKSRAGEALYRENCSVCHEIDKPQSKKPGPVFYQLFKREKMPMSNGKPSRAYVAVRIQFGGALMPAFRTVLTKAQIETLIDYMESR